MLNTTTEFDPVTVLSEQLSWHFENRARPRLDGLTDEELHREPLVDCWGVRRRSSPEQKGSGDWTIDFGHPAPDPAPVTTIGWRLAHVIVGVLGARAASHFDATFSWGIADYDAWPYAGTADEALAQLDATYAAWSGGVRGLTVDDLHRRVGPAEGPWAEHSMGELVAHINREAIHHLAEIALLRDLYAHR